MLILAYFYSTGGLSLLKLYFLIVVSLLLLKGQLCSFREEIQTSNFRNDTN